MNFFTILLLIFLGIYLTGRFFGRTIIGLLMQRLFKKVMKEAEKEAHNYERHYEGGHFRDNVYVDNEVKVSAPRQHTRPKVSADEIAEDIEFDEL